MNDNIIWFTRESDTIKAWIMCPACGTKKLRHLPFVQIQCDDCKKRYKTSLHQSIAEKKMAEIVYKFNNCDEVIFRAEEYYLEPLNHIKNCFSKMPLWEVSEITKINVKESNMCMMCGRCPSCKKYTKDSSKCEHCNAEIDKYKMKHTRTRDIICPKCGNEKLSMGKAKPMHQLTYTRKAPYKLNNL